MTENIFSNLEKNHPLTQQVAGGTHPSAGTTTQLSMTGLTLADLPSAPLETCGLALNK